MKMKMKMTAGPKSPDSLESPAGAAEQAEHIKDIRAAGVTDSSGGSEKGLGGKSGIGRFRLTGPLGIALIVFFGGAAGTLLRMTLDLLPQPWVQYANITACLLMGGSCALLRLKSLGPLWRQGVNAGFLGGLSTFASPLLELTGRRGLDSGSAAWELLPQIALFLLCCAAGFVLTLRLGRRLQRARQRR